MGKLWKSIGVVGYLKYMLGKRLAEKKTVRFVYPAFISPHIPVHTRPETAFPSAEPALYTVRIQAGDKRL